MSETETPEDKTMHGVTRRVFTKLFGTREFTGIEIGVLGGGWTNYILTYFPNCTMIHAIDPWRHFNDNLYERSFTQDVMDENYQIYCNKMLQFPTRHTTWRMESWEAIKHLKDVRVDFIFIDGCHDERFVEEDVINYRPLVKPGGFFGGHDYGQAEGVTHVVDKYFPDAQKGHDFTWWIKVP